MDDAFGVVVGEGDGVGHVAYVADVWDVLVKIEYSLAKQNELLAALVVTNQRIAVALENKETRRKKGDCL